MGSCTNENGPILKSNGDQLRQYTDVFSEDGRTYSMSLKYNFGKLQEDKRRGRGQSFRGGGQMDMGY